MSTLQADPFRLAVLKRLSASIEQISVGAGYHYDLTGKCFRGRLLFGDNDPIPMISIIEPPLPIDRIEAPIKTGVSSGDWELLIQGFVADDRKHPTDPAHVLVADVKRALTLESKRVALGTNVPDILGFGVPATLNGVNIGNVVQSLKVGPGVVRPPEDQISNKAYFLLGVTLKIIEDNANPFLY
jgi:hypothetical protein